MEKRKTHKSKFLVGMRYILQLGRVNPDVDINIEFEMKDIQEF